MNFRFDDDAQSIASKVSKTSAENNELQSLTRSDNLLKLHSTDVINESTTPLDLCRRNRFKLISVKTCHICEICMKSFAQSCDLRRHIRTHSGEKPYSCEICKKSFNDSGNLRYHMRIHTGDKPYSCKFCEKSFAGRSNLQRHVRSHTGEKPYICGICSESFIESVSLNRHMRKHTGEKPFTCRTCGKPFTMKSDLQCHLRRHTGEKPFICQTCKKSFAQKGDLKRHLKTHTGDKYLYDVCQKSFACSGGLTSHIRIHAGLKPCTTDVCVKSFGDSYDQLDMRTSAIGNPFSSKTCMKPFVSPQTLKPHLSSHTEGERTACSGFSDVMRLSTTVTLSSGEKLFVCKFCYKSFPSTEAFGRHTETPDFEKQCRVSDMNDSHQMVEKQLFNTEMNLAVGQDECNTSTVAPAAETMRDFIFDEKSDIQEDCKLTAKLYGCGICDKMFFSDKAFLAHCRNHKSHTYAEFWYQL